MADLRASGPVPVKSVKNRTDTSNWHSSIFSPVLIGNYKLFPPPCYDYYSVSTVRFTISTMYFCGFYFRDFSGVISLVMFDTLMILDA